MPRLTNAEWQKEMNAFGKRLKIARETAGIDKRTFADRCGLSYKHYFNIENGATRPGMMAYIGIVRALGIKDVPLVG